MAALTELRGALGGGLAATNWIGGAAPTHVAANRVRVVPGKREARRRAPRNYTLYIGNDSQPSSITHDSLFDFMRVFYWSCARSTQVLSDELIARFQKSQKKGLLSSCLGGVQDGPRILGVIGHTRYFF